MKFQVSNFSILGNLIAHINSLQAEGKSPLVTVSDKTEDRSSAQNRLMHMWFKDIAKSTGHGIIYEAGRCKMRYFLPMLRLSSDEKAQFAIDLCEMAYKQKGQEYLIRALGEGLIESTRHLKTKEFEEALTEMQMGESQHKLTDPTIYGMRWAQ